jgi:hypothetical protein
MNSSNRHFCQGVCGSRWLGWFGWE